MFALPFFPKLHGALIPVPCLLRIFLGAATVIVKVTYIVGGIFDALLGGFPLPFQSLFMIRSNTRPATEAESYRKLSLRDSLSSGLQFKGKTLFQISWHTLSVSVAMAKHMHGPYITMPGRFVHPFETSRMVFSTNDAFQIEKTNVVFGIRISRVGRSEIVLKGAATASSRAQAIIIDSPQPFVSVYMAKASGSL